MKYSRPIRLASTLLLIGLLFSLLGLLNAQLAPSPTGGWKLTGAMSQARSGAVAAAMNSGNVLVTGGTDQAGVVSASAEIYGSSGTFIVAAPMHVARTGHTATWLANPNGSGGFVLVTGGTAISGAILASAELYDPLANSWTLLSAQMSADNTGEPATLLPNSSVLLSGGSNSYSMLAGLESFNLVSQAFTPVGSMTTARKNHAAAALLDGRVLIVGGTDGSGNTLASTAIYDPVDGTVTVGPSLNTPRAYTTATTLLDGRVLIAGGSYPEGASANGNVAELNTAEIFDPVANTITMASAKLAQARTAQQAFLLPNNSNVLLVGGTYNGATLASSELYTPWLSQFAATGSMSVPRSSASGAALFPLADGQLLIAGGTNQQPNMDLTVANSAELYGFATLETNAGDYSPGTAVLISGTGWKPNESVTITLNEDPKVEAIPILTTTADANGNISDGNYAPNPLDLGIRYYALAVGATSGLQAQNTFTDSYYAGHGVTFGVNPVATGNSLGVVDTTHPNGTDSFAPASCSAASCSQTSPTTFATNYGDTLQFTATAGTGYRFSSWTSSYTGTAPTSNTCTTGSTPNPCSFIVPTGTGFAATVTANFTTIPTKLAITSVNSGSNPAAGTAFSVVVQSQSSSGTAINVISATAVTLSLATGTGTLGGTLTGTIAAGTSSVTISGLTYTRAESGVSLMATRTSGDLLTTGTSGTFTVNAGVATQLSIETAANGSGTVLTPLNVTSGNTVTGYAIQRDASGNFVANVSATWSLTSMTGGVVAGDLSPLTGTSAIFTGHKTGSATIHAVASSLNATSNVLTVVAGAVTQLSIETAANGSGTVLTPQNVTSNNTVTGYAIQRDASGNFVANVSATWSLTSMTGGVVAGDLSPLTGTSAIFTGHKTGSATIHAVALSLNATSNVLTVVAGAPTQLAFTTPPAGGTAGTQWVSQPVVTVQDANSNTVTSSSASITLTIGTGSGSLVCTPNPVSASSGVATFTTCGINNAGSYTLTASATGLASATSSTLVVNASATTTTLALTAGLNSSTYGTALTFTATVAPSVITPLVGPIAETGTVTFLDNGNPIGTVTLSAGAGPYPTATFTTSALSAVSHSITAVYTSGDGNYTGSVSAVFTQTVNQATPTVTWPNPADIFYGTALSSTQLNATASVGGAFGYTPATGTVLGAGNNQTLSVTFIPSDSTNYKSVTQPASINVNRVLLVVTATSTSATYGQPTPPALGYSITGFVNGDSQAVVGGQPDESTAGTSSAPGAYPISISLGTLSAANYGFTFVAGVLQLNQAPSTGVVTALNSIIYPNQTTTLTATVSTAGPAAPTGTVTFYSGLAALGGAVSLTAIDQTDATATLSLSGSQISVGANSITAVYSGDTNYLSSTSPALIETLGSNQVSSGSSNVGSQGATQTLTYSFTSDTRLSAVNILTGGISGLDYADGGSSSCTAGVLYTAGQTCTVTVAFTPSASGVRAGGVALFAQGSTLPMQTWYLNGVGQSGAVAIDPGTQTTLATLSNSGLAGGSAVDGAGNVYIVDRVNGQVIKLAAGTFAPTSIVASGLLSPTAVALDGAGNLYISDTGNSRVVMVPNEQGTLNVADLSIVAITGLGSPRGIAVDGNGFLYVVDSTDGNVIQVHGSGGAQVNVVSGLTAPHGVAVDASGNVYVTSTGGVFEYPLVAGPPITYGPAVQYGTGYGNPRGIAVDASGTVYVADTGSSQIVVVAPGGATQANLALTEVTNPQGVTVDAFANIYVTVGGSVLEVNRTLAALTFTNANIGLTSAPQVLTVTDVGNQQLTLSGLAVTANFTQAPSGGTDCSTTTSLGSAGQCLIAAAFAPTASGPLGGMITLNDNALNLASMQTVQLSGTGALDPQTITFTLTFGSVTFGDGPIPLSATVNSPLAINFQVTSGPGYIRGGNNLVMTGAGSVVVTATQDGDGTTYAAATPVSHTVTVAPANQSSLAVTGMPGTAQPYGTSFAVGAAGGSGTGSLTFTASGACSNAGSTVTMISGTGTCSVTATMAADSNYNSATSAALTVGATKAMLMVTASSATVTYGVAVPTIAASYSGFVNPDTVSVLTAPPTCSTAYTTTSAAGTVPSTSCSGATAANYTFTYVNGSLTISQDQTAISLQTSAASVMWKSGVTFTAKVSGSTATPTGSVSFSDGGSTIGTGTLDNTGTATLTVNTLAAGPHSITAGYASSVNFVGSSSSALSETVQDFNFTVGGATTTLLSATVVPGSTAGYTFQIAPTAGTTFDAAVTLTLTGLPAGATYTISPSATIAAGSGTATVTVSVSTSAQQASLTAPSPKDGGAFPKALVLAIFLPLLGTRKLRHAVRAHLKASALMMVMLAVLTVGGMTACGGHSSTPPAQTYAMTLTGTSGAAQHTVTLNLTVQ